MSMTMPGSEFLSLLIWGNAKAALLVGLAILVVVLMRRLSAASRHLLWACVILASLLLPILSGLLPSLQIPILPTTVADTAGVAPGAGGQPFSGPAADAAFPFALTDVLFAVYALGGIALLASFVRALVQLYQIERAAQTVSEASLVALKDQLCGVAGVPRSVRLLVSDRIDTPMTWGLMRPRIALPRAALRWPQAQLRSALLHELAHIRRCDWLGLWLARIACAAYWFNPLTWLAVRQLTLEAEKACDDFVLCHGSRPSDYARQLVELATTRETGVLARAGMGLGESELSQRVSAILHPANRRNDMNRTQILVLTAAVLGAASVLAACQATSAAPTSDTASDAVPPVPAWPSAPESVPGPRPVAAQPPAPPEPPPAPAPEHGPEQQEIAAARAAEAREIERARRELEAHARALQERQRTLEREAVRHHQEMERVRDELERQQAELAQQFEVQREHMMRELEAMERARAELERERHALEQRELLKQRELEELRRGQES